MVTNGLEASNGEVDPTRIVCVVGAPRSGDTSLCQYLKGHPDVAFSIVKEPHFFSQFDLTELPDGELRETVQAEYLSRYFPDVGPSKSVLAEGSVTYLYRAEQMLPILRVWPEAKFIIAIRDPMELLPSLHQRLLYLGDEVVTDFARAWALTDRRRKGLNVPPSCVDHRWLLYDEVGRLGEYVEKFIATVGRERCHIVLFDDLIRDPQGVYARMLKFIGLRADGRTDFRVHRASRGLQDRFPAAAAETASKGIARHCRRRSVSPTGPVTRYAAGTVGAYSGHSCGSEAPVEVECSDAAPCRHR